MELNFAGTRVKISFWFAAAMCLMLITDDSGGAAMAVLAACLHECGHLIAFKLQKQGISMIGFTPYGMKIVPSPGSSISYSKEIQAALGGPLVNLGLFFFSGAIGHIFSSDMAAIFSGINAGLFIFNMLPVGCLDGGRIIYACTALISNEDKADDLLKILGHAFATLCTVLYIFGTAQGATNANQLICLIFVISLAFFKA